MAAQGVGVAEQAKGAVVPTKPIPTAAAVRIVGGHHVPGLENSSEGWQGAPHLERGGEPARWRGAGCAAPCFVSGRDQLDPGTGVAALDRGDGSRDGAAADAVAVSGGSLRRAVAGCFDRPAETVAGAAAAAAAMGCLLAGAGTVAWAGSRPVLGGPAGAERQRHALGPGAVRAGGLSAVGAGQRMAAAPRMVRAQRACGSPGRGCRAGREPQALSLSRPVAGAQAGSVRASDRALARPVQYLVRRAAL